MSDQGKGSLPATRQSGIVAVRPTTKTVTRQNLSSFVGISEATAGAKGISMNLVIIPPGGAAIPHLHRGFERAIYALLAAEWKLVTAQG